jgi:hypothetical protein
MNPTDTNARVATNTIPLAARVTPPRSARPGGGCQVGPWRLSRPATQPMGPGWPRESLHRREELEGSAGQQSAGIWAQRGRRAVDEQVLIAGVEEDLDGSLLSSQLLGGDEIAVSSAKKGSASMACTRG